MSSAPPSAAATMRCTSAAAMSSSSSGLLHNAPQHLQGGHSLASRHARTTRTFAPQPLLPAEPPRQCASDSFAWARRQSVSKPILLPSFRYEEQGALQCDLLPGCNHSRALLA